MFNEKEYQGLNSEKVKELQKKFGFNEIKEKEKTFLGKLFKKIFSPIPLMIETALLLSAVVSHWSDFWIILILLLVNLSVDFFQERKAKKALDVLKENLAPTAIVLRNGKFSEIDARELVPGDIVKLSIGDIAPADGKILELKDTLFNQSTITGESLPVEKKKVMKFLHLLF